MHAWIVFLHVASVFAFAFAHGVSAWTILRLRRERDRERVRLLLDLSQSGVRVADLAALALIIFGVWAGIDGGWFGNGQLWLWASIVLLVAVTVVMGFFVSRHTYAWRGALVKEPPIADQELDRLLSSPQPLYGAALGLVGFVIILWLMMLRPFSTRGPTMTQVLPSP